MKWLDIFKVIGPAVLAIVPGAAPFAPLIVAGITVAEEVGGAGADKKKIALEVTTIGAQAANLAAKKTIIDPAAAVTVADNAVDAVVGAVNLIQAAQAARIVAPIAGASVLPPTPPPATP